jgi:predicted kinase
MSKRVVILKGLPGCGKTTWAKEQIEKQPGRYKRISKDDLRAMMDNGHWSKGNEKFILEARNLLILGALQEGYHVLVDDTNLHSRHEQAIRELVKGLAVVEIKDFTDVPLDVCIERDKKRPNYVGEDTIRKMHRDFLKPAPAQAPAYVWGLPDAVICDLDGTLALMNGRNPYDASTCEEDLLNEPIADIVRWQYDDAETVLLVSGRSEKHREPTERWLKKHAIKYHHLFMRKEGDNRRDYIIKQEIYEQEIAGKYNILFVLDDRKQVVQVWRSYGLTCLQVAEGDY